MYILCLNFNQEAKFVAGLWLGCRVSAKGGHNRLSLIINARSTDSQASYVKYQIEVNSIVVAFCLLFTLFALQGSWCFLVLFLVKWHAVSFGYLFTSYNSPRMFCRLCCRNFCQKLLWDFSRCFGRCISFRFHVVYNNVKIF